MIHPDNHDKLIINMICEHYGEDLTCLYDTSRIQRKVFARQLVMLWFREKGHSLHEIGNFLKKDHTTVIHGLRSAEQLVISTESTRSFWNRINLNFAA